MKKLLPLLLLILIGCSEPEPINIDELVYEDGIFLKDNKPYSGSVFSLYKEEYFKGSEFLLKGDPDQIGRISNEFVLKDGKSHGLMTNYLSDKESSVSSTGNYKNGTIDGLVKFYRRDVLELVLTYKDDIMDGPYKKYYVNSLHGQIYEEGSYKNDKRNGPYTQYYQTGQIKEKGTYKDERRHGEIISFTESGLPLSSKNYINGEWDGLPLGWKLREPKD